MLFNSSAFLAFYLFLFPLYWLIHRHIRARNTLLLIGSYFFYGSWDWRFLGLIAISTLVDFYCGKAIHASNNVVIRRRYLILSLLVNLGILAFFKYFGFFVSSFVDLLGLLGIQANIHSLNIILPVGISFYTFQTLSYTIDIYYGKLKPTNNLLNFATFVAFFPQLVAGPIERASELLPQIERRTSFNYIQFREGLFLILWGLFKKTLIADRLAVYVDLVFADPTSFTGEQCLIAVSFFAVQIYCDFSGYSDIARGLAKTMGIELMVNFNAPYFALSIREFWQRWHISLSTWFRDYVYIPLGGSKTSGLRLKRNLLVTFVVSGLWHGAAYTFLVWGFLHAFGYLLDPHTRWLRVKGGITPVWHKYTGFLWTFLFVNFAWIFFRSESIGDATTVIESMTSAIAELGQTGPGAVEASYIVGMNNTEFMLSLYFISTLFFTDYFLKDRGIEAVSSTMSIPVRWLFSWFLLVNLVLLAPSDTGAFIYFQF